MINYTIDECKKVIETHSMNEYHKELMKFLIKRVENLESRLNDAEWGRDSTALRTLGDAY